MGVLVQVVQHYSLDKQHLESQDSLQNDNPKCMSHPPHQPNAFLIDSMHQRGDQGAL